MGDSISCQHGKRVSRQVDLQHLGWNHCIAGLPATTAGHCACFCSGVGGLRWRKDHGCVSVDRTEEPRTDASATDWTTGSPTSAGFTEFDGTLIDCHLARQHLQLQSKTTFGQCTHVSETTRPAVYLISKRHTHESIAQTSDITYVVSLVLLI